PPGRAVGPLRGRGVRRRPARGGRDGRPGGGGTDPAHGGIATLPVQRQALPPDDQRGGRGRPRAEVAGGGIADRGGPPRRGRREPVQGQAGGAEPGRQFLNGRAKPRAASPLFTPHKRNEAGGDVAHRPRPSVRRAVDNAGRTFLSAHRVPLARVISRSSPATSAPAAPGPPRQARRRTTATTHGTG